MTIVYREASTLSLLCRWKGSIWKHVWKELLIFYAFYFSLSGWYRFGLSDYDKRRMNIIIVSFNEYLKYIPITFLLGFYVSSMVSRWWQQFTNVAWPDDLCGFINFVLPDNDADSVKLRRVLARYLVLTSALAWRDISIRIRKRFPTTEHFVQAGLMTKPELRFYQETKVSTLKWMLPLDWMQRHLEKLVKDGKVAAPFANSFLGCINQYRLRFHRVLCFDWVTVPLIYTQVAGLATYSYFLFCIIGRQYLEPEHEIKGYELDMYLPIFTTLQFLFYVGWFKVGQDIMRPFGEDEDDFELNYILDRNFRVAFGLVDNIRAKELPPADDPYEGQRNMKLPHTLASAGIKERAPKLKVAKVSKHGKYADRYKFVSTAVVTPDETENLLSEQSPIVKKWKQIARKSSIVEVAKIMQNDDDVSVHSLAV